VNEKRVSDEQLAIRTGDAVLHKPSGGAPVGPALRLLPVRDDILGPAKCEEVTFPDALAAMGGKR
jgi:hypothetical protein